MSKLAVVCFNVMGEIEKLRGSLFNKDREPHAKKQDTASDPSHT